MGDGNFNLDGNTLFGGEASTPKIFPNKSDEDVVKEINKNNEFRANYTGEEVETQELNPETSYWRSAKIRLKDGELKRVSASIKKIKKLIEKARKLITQLRQFATLLTKLEQLISAPFDAIIIEIQKRLRAALKEVGAAGVYVLSTHEYTNFTNEPLIKTEVPKTPSAVTDLISSSDSFASSLFNYYESQKDPITKATQKDLLNTTGDYYAGENVNIGEIKLPFPDKDVILKIGNHRPILYSEFIEVIAASFLDEMDLPDGDLVNNSLVARDPENLNPLSYDEWSKKDLFDKVINNNKGEAFFRSGRPIANEGTKIEVLVLAIAVPNFGLFMSQIGTLSYFFGSFLESMWNSMVQTARLLKPMLNGIHRTALENQIKLVEQQIKSIEVEQQKVDKQKEQKEQEKRQKFGSKTSDSLLARIKPLKQKSDAGKKLTPQEEKNFNDLKTEYNQLKKFENEISDLGWTSTEFMSKSSELNTKVTNMKLELANLDADDKLGDKESLFGLEIEESWTRTKFGIEKLFSSEVNGIPDADTQNSIIDLVDLRKTANKIQGGDPPDFYGVSLNSLFRPLFIQLENLINKLEGLKTHNFGLGKLLEKFLSKVEKKIRKLEQILNLIEQIIQQIEALLAMNISMLKISTTKGNYDVYEKIINSKGFPSETVQTPMYHFGFAMVYVEPDFSNSTALQKAGSVALGNFFKDTQSQFDPEIGAFMGETKDGVAAIEQLLGIKK